MARKGKQRARVESADDDEDVGLHGLGASLFDDGRGGDISQNGGDSAGWGWGGGGGGGGGGGWDQEVDAGAAADTGDAGWHQGDQWGIRPTDSASNVEPTPPAKHTLMNWGAPSPLAKPVQIHGHARQAAHDIAMLGSAHHVNAQQQQARELRKQLKQQQQQLQHMIPGWNQTDHHRQQHVYQQQQETQYPMHHQQQTQTKRHTGKHKKAEVAPIVNDVWNGAGAGDGGLGGTSWGNDSWGMEGTGPGAGAGGSAAEAGGWGRVSTVVHGGLGGGDAWDAWDGGDEDARTKNHVQAPGIATQPSWGGWAPEPETQQHGANFPNGKTPKVTVTSPSSLYAKTVLSPKQQQSNSLAGFLGRAFLGNQGQKETRNRHAQSHEEGKKNKITKKKKIVSPPATTWPEAIEEEEEEEEEGDEYYDDEEYDEDGGLGKHRTWFAEAGNGWDDSTLPMPSKAYALAAEGRVPPIRRVRNDNYGANNQILESHGAALASAQRAFYSKDRLARNRIHWLFDPRKDERVSTLLDWIQMMHYGVAEFGFKKFLQTRERGALFVNADYRPPMSPNEPTFDWLTFDNVQLSMDRTLQESLAFYDPSTQILVFVFLLSKTQNSMAIWRRKLPLPNNIRLKHGSQLTQAMAGLKKQYPIYIDETLEAAPTPAVPSKRSKSTMKKWLRWGRS